MPGDLAAAAGTPANFGKVGDAGKPPVTLDGDFTYPWTALADADPLGVNQNVTFDEVGGLDDRLSFHLSLITAS
jgi:ATPase family AAA domain-containing protein 2